MKYSFLIQAITENYHQDLDELKRQYYSHVNVLCLNLLILFFNLFINYFKSPVRDDNNDMKMS